MIPLFIGMTTSNLLLLCGVFAMGLFVIGAEGKPTGLYAYHISLAIAAAFVTLATHIGTYMYFMATSRWLQATTDKVGVEETRFAGPALENKRRVFPVLMTPIVMVMLAAFAGAGADRTMSPMWSPRVHLVIAGAAIAANVFAALLELKYIHAQKKLMEDATSLFSKNPNVIIEQ